MLPIHNNIDLEVLLSLWCVETHTFVMAWDEFTPTLEVRLTYLPLFFKETAVGIELEEDQVKLKYLMVSMTTSRSSMKFTYGTWL